MCGLSNARRPTRTVASESVLSLLTCGIKWLCLSVSTKYKPQCKPESFPAIQWFEKKHSCLARGAKEAEVSEERLKVVSAPVCELVKTTRLVRSYE